MEQQLTPIHRVVCSIAKLHTHQLLVDSHHEQCEHQRRAPGASPPCLLVEPPSSVLTPKIGILVNSGR
ncbi:hypothetical protein EJB05_22487, partial [Eragrostis curvula]